MCGHNQAVPFTREKEKRGMERFHSTLQRFGIKDKDKSNNFYLETAQNIE